MKILEKLRAKHNNMYGNESVTVAFIGDSITQGCFECYFNANGGIETVYDYKSAFATRFREILNIIYPNVQLNVINSGISGDGALGVLRRLERDVLRFSPDLVIINSGLNDCVMGGDEKLDSYAKALEAIFEKCKAAGAECIMLTECMLNDTVSPHILSDKLMVEYAERFMAVQKSGLLDKYFDKAREVARAANVPVCDQYAIWTLMNSKGVNTTELLANKLNHPIREWHYYMAIKLIETIFGI